MRSAAKSTWYGAAFTKRAAALAAAGIVGFSDGRAMAQQVSDTHIPNASHSQDLKEVDQGFGDEGPLRTSLRDFSVDLRLPTGFQKVYQVPGREDELMRVSGGLIAVFPRSVYATGRGGGQLPLIPPGTVYYIGGIELFPRAVGPTGDSSVALPSDPYGLRMLNRRGTRTTARWQVIGTDSHGGAQQTYSVATPPMAESTPGYVEPAVGQAENADVPTVANDAEFRVKRIRQLMQIALANESLGPVSERARLRDTDEAEDDVVGVKPEQ